MHAFTGAAPADGGGGVRLGPQFHSVVSPAMPCSVPGRERRHVADSEARCDYAAGTVMRMSYLVSCHAARWRAARDD